MKRTCLWLIVWLLFMSVSTEATFAGAQELEDDRVTPQYVDYELLPIPTHKQERNKWCWAASSEMVIDYLGGNETQSDIVKYVKGSLINEGGTDQEVKKGLKWAGLASTIKYDTIPFRTIISQIKNNQPLLAHIIWHSNDEGHMLVIRGYKENTDDGTWSVYYKDPWPDSETNNVRSYGAFRNNNAFYWSSTLHEIYVK